MLEKEETMKKEVMRKFVKQFYFDESATVTETNVHSDRDLLNNSNSELGISPKLRVTMTFRGLLSEFYMRYGKPISFMMRESGENAQGDQAAKKNTRYWRFTSEVEHVHKNEICEACRSQSINNRESAVGSVDNQDATTNNCESQDAKIAQTLEEFCENFAKDEKCYDSFKDHKHEMQSYLNKKIALNEFENSDTPSKDIQSAQIEKIPTNALTLNSKEIPYIIRYRCPRTGFIEFAIPYLLEGEYIGSFLSGQCHTEENNTYLDNVLKDLEKSNQINVDQSTNSGTESGQRKLTIPKPVSQEEVSKQQNIFMNHVIEIINIVAIWKKEYYQTVFHELQRKVLDTLMQETDTHREEQYSGGDTKEEPLEDKTDYEKCLGSLRKLEVNIENAMRILKKNLDLNVVMYFRDNPDPPEYTEEYENVIFEMNPHPSSSHNSSLSSICVTKNEGYTLPESTDSEKWHDLTPGEREFPVIAMVKLPDMWNRQNYGLLDELLQIAGRYICSRGSGVLSFFNSNRLKSYTLHMRHEIAQKIIGMTLLFNP
jgi:hypothetical protein